MKKIINFIQRVYYYVSLRFIQDAIDKKYVPNGTISERVLLILRLFSLLIAVMLISKLII
nr:hypothetical protein [uncultured bacterium]